MPNKIKPTFFSDICAQLSHHLDFGDDDDEDDDDDVDDDDVKKIKATFFGDICAQLSHHLGARHAAAASTHHPCKLCSSRPYLPSQEKGQ